MAWTIYLIGMVLSIFMVIALYKDENQIYVYDILIILLFISCSWLFVIINLFFKNWNTIIWRRKR